MSLEKDIIYIDTDDDITSIITKIKASKLKIVALVPPKRTGVLQSAVNLRLIARVAEDSNKKLVIITANKALISLSAVAMIPIAKNLNSKPQLAEADEPADDGDVDVIDGSKLAVGDLARTAPKNGTELDDDMIEEIKIDDLDEQSNDDKSSKEDKSKVSPKKSNIKVPNFNSFRNKLFMVLGGLVGLAIFMVWAIVFAPAAKIIITANTTNTPVSLTVKLGGTEPTDVSKNIIQTVTKQVKKDLSVEFVATGTKDVGTKASGNITLSFNNMPIKKMPVEAGQRVKFGDKIFIIQNDITISTDTVGAAGFGSGKVLAAENGEVYNIPAGNCSVIEYPAINCSSSSAMAGGTTNIVAIVTAADVQKASQILVDLPSDSVKDQLAKQFNSGEKIINESFLIDRAEAVSEPAIGKEVEGKAKLTSATNYSLTAIAESEIKVFLKDSISKQMTDSRVQKIQDYGIDKVILSSYIRSDEQSTINISTIGKIGPNISNKYILSISKGKRFGDIQSALNRIDGIDDVEVKFSYFWVSRVPKDESKIEIEFKSKDAKQ